MLQIKNLTVWFTSNGITEAIRDVSLDVADKKKTMLVGETGSGKSVLLLAILRLLPPTASVSGQVLLDGTNLFSLTNRELCSIRGVKIGYIPQGGGNSMNPLLKVGYQVGESLREHKGYTKKKALAEAVRLLKKFYLGNEEQIVKVYPHMLSGGMRQRTMIAMGIAAGAPILLADEPTKGLDPLRIKSVEEAFEMLKDQTLLCVTHDLQFARRIGDYICIMYASCQMEYSSVSDFFEKPLHPYSKALLAAQPENGLQCSIGFAPSRENLHKYGCVFYDSCDQHLECCKKIPPMFDVGNRKVRCWLYENTGCKPE